MLTGKSYFVNGNKGESFRMRGLHGNKDKSGIGIMIYRSLAIGKNYSEPFFMCIRQKPTNVI